MQAKQVMRPCVMLLLAVTVTAVVAQPQPCSTVPFFERAYARATGVCHDPAPIVDVVPEGAEAKAPSVVPVPSVVGLSFDAARGRLAGFTLQRSYRPSNEPGGTVLEQQPAPPARLAAGTTVRVVLSDGTLRPAPRVAASDVDEPPKPQATNRGLRPQPYVVPNNAPTGRVIEQSPARTVQPNDAAQSEPSADRAGVGTEIERLPVPNVLGMTIQNAQARLGRFNVERSDRPSSAPAGRVIEQISKGSSRTAAGPTIVLVVSSGPARRIDSPRAVDARATPTEMFELPNVIDRSYADASRALAEFKVERIEIASAAPMGQVLAQDPAPGTSVRPGSAMTLRVSDGSLASPAVTTPAALPATLPATSTAPALPPESSAAASPAPAPAPSAETSPAPSIETSPAPSAETLPATSAETSPVPSAETSPASSAATSPAPSVEPMPAPAPVQDDRSSVRVPSNTALLLAAGVLLGLLLGALLARRWLLSRRPTMDVQAAGPTVASSSGLGISAVPAPETAPEIRFAARLDAGETTIEFTASSDADADADADAEESIAHSGDVHG